MVWRDAVINQTTWLGGNLNVNEDEIQVHDGLERDCHPLAIKNLVVRALRKQSRRGIGSDDTMLPVTAFTHLMDRWAGKVVDRVKMAMSTRPFEGETDGELATRAETIRRQLEARKPNEKETD